MIPENRFPINIFAAEKVNLSSSIRTKENSWYTGQNDFIFCLGYIPAGEKIHEIKITFNQKGTYHFDSINVLTEDVRG